MTTQREKTATATRGHRQERKAAVAPAHKPAEPQRPILRFEPVQAACGHLVGFPIYQGDDRYREARRIKYQTKAQCPKCAEEGRRFATQVLVRKTACPECRESREPFRLPDCAAFVLEFDGHAGLWEGSLQVGEVEYRGRHKSLARLTRMLGEQWRKTT